VVGVDNVGEAVGDVVGEDEVGEIVGEAEGVDVEGDKVGVEVGEESVGDVVGDVVGDIVGEVVGDVVGASVSHTSNPSGQIGTDSLMNGRQYCCELLQGPEVAAKHPPHRSYFRGIKHRRWN
jgi:hypothetical protein